LSRLYDYEISKQSKFEEKLFNLKQLAEEKQIESAALKFEYRKIKELKENLLAENSYLKSLLGNVSSPQKLANLSNGMQSSSSSSPSSNLSEKRNLNISTNAVQGNNSPTSVSTTSLSQIGSNNLTPTFQSG
jgi:hypothetical protein